MTGKFVDPRRLRDTKALPKELRGIANFYSGVLSAEAIDMVLKLTGQNRRCCLFCTSTG